MRPSAAARPVVGASEIQQGVHFQLRFLLSASAELSLLLTSVEVTLPGSGADPEAPPHVFELCSRWIHPEQFQAGFRGRLAVPALVICC